ncbi:MAG TPA: hypothetical protein VG387_15610 [Rhizomicrobium sp.]|jgi:hypothetical protein|nr:hypothetical protein [Rhizomicrobium sp.]
MTSLVPRSLLAVVLGLAGVVAYQVLAPVPEIPDPPAQTLPARAAPPIASYTPPPRESYAVVNARPLFDAARRPIAEAQALDAASLAPPDVSLIGVIIGPRGAVALLRAADAPAAVTVRQGESIKGWELVQVTSDHVVLRTGVNTFTISIRGAKGIPQPDLKKQTAPGDAAPASAPAAQ